MTDMTQPSNLSGTEQAGVAPASTINPAVLGDAPATAMGNLFVATSPASAMTGWLAADEVPGNFTIDRDAELRASGESRAAIRYVKHALEADEVRRHIQSGKQCTRLALTWADRVSFVLTESLDVKRVAPLDVIKESEDTTLLNDDEKFESDFTLMTGELAKLMAELVDTLGGEKRG